MKIAIIGATGNAGRAIYAEAVTRGHKVTAMVREPDRARALLGPNIVVLAKNAFDLVADDLTRVSTGTMAVALLDEIEHPTHVHHGVDPGRCFASASRCVTSSHSNGYRARAATTERFRSDDRCPVEPSQTRCAAGGLPGRRKRGGDG